MLRKNSFIFEFSFFSLLCPFFVWFQKYFEFPLLFNIAYCCSLFLCFFFVQKNCFDFSLNFQYLQRYTKKEQASGLVSF